MSVPFVRRFIVGVLGFTLACHGDRLRLSGSSSTQAVAGLAAGSSLGAWPWPDEKTERLKQLKAQRREELREAREEQEEAQEGRRIRLRAEALEAARARARAAKENGKRKFISSPPRSTEAFGRKVASTTRAPLTRHLTSQEKFGEEAEAEASTMQPLTKQLQDQNGFGERVAMTSSTTTTTTITTTTTTSTTTTTTTATTTTTTTWRNSTAGSSFSRQPRVYFLFLAVDKISNLGVWEHFFSHGSKSQYRAFVHCKEESCESQTYGGPIKSIPTVAGSYCTDLVSPMNKLISYALEYASDDPHPQDKFAFVSDSTLPAKPFQNIYRTLIGRDGSDFCVFPSQEWADIREGQNVEMAPKFHQWITLTRAHAEKASQLWDQGYLRNLMDHFEINKKAWMWMDNSYGDGRNFGCLDEFWHMAAIYGTLENVDPHHGTTYRSLEHFSGGTLRVGEERIWQGECDTFVNWSKYMHTGNDNVFERLHYELDHMSIPHDGNAARPGWWDTISEIGVKAIRDSDFLFVRKFIDAPMLAASADSFEAAWTRIVFA